MTELLPEQTQRLERLAQRPASEIDLSDMPETTNWEGAVRGQRPIHPRAELTAEHKEQLEGLSKIRDEDIDFSDIPEITNWEGAVRGWENHPARAQNKVNLHLSANLERRLQEIAQQFCPCLRFKAIWSSKSSVAQLKRGNFKMGLAVE